MSIKIYFKSMFILLMLLVFVTSLGSIVMAEGQWKWVDASTEGREWVEDENSWIQETHFIKKRGWSTTHWSEDHSKMKANGRYSTTVVTEILPETLQPGITHVFQLKASTHSCYNMDSGIYARGSLMLITQGEKPKQLGGVIAEGINVMKTSVVEFKVPEGKFGKKLVISLVGDNDIKVKQIYEWRD